MRKKIVKKIEYRIVRFVTKFSMNILYPRKRDSRRAATM